jgi:hypothetical protein
MAHPAEPPPTTMISASTAYLFPYYVYNDRYRITRIAVRKQADLAARAIVRLVDKSRRAQQDRSKQGDKYRPEGSGGDFGE